ASLPCCGTATAAPATRGLSVRKRDFDQSQPKRLACMRDSHPRRVSTGASESVPSLPRQYPNHCLFVVPRYTFLANPALAGMPGMVYRTPNNSSPRLAAHLCGSAGHSAITTPSTLCTFISLYGARRECVALRCYPTVL